MVSFGTRSAIRLSWKNRYVSPISISFHGSFFHGLEYIRRPGGLGLPKAAAQGQDRRRLVDRMCGQARWPVRPGGRKDLGSDREFREGWFSRGRIRQTPRE